MANDATVIELTSKRWKGLKLFSFFVMFVFATILYANNVEAWGFVFGLGVLLYIVARIGAWWNHG